MPLREGGFQRLECLPVDERWQHEKHFQTHWYRHAGRLVSGHNVLDVGAASGYGMDIVRESGASDVHGIDPLPLRSDVEAVDVLSFDSRAFDYVLAIDVIEHVEDDVGFLRQLVRIARLGVFFSTPNWLVSRAANPYHVREYTPEELDRLVSGHRVRLWTSDDDCQIRQISTTNDASSNFGVLLEVCQ